jgi:hypothetical protein
MLEVEVVKHFNEDSFSHGLAQGMADRLRDALADVRCPEHDEEGSVRVSTEGVAQTLNDLHIDIAGCCPAVVERVREVVSRVQGKGAPG